jgi:hypothetical protein
MDPDANRSQQTLLRMELLQVGDVILTSSQETRLWSWVRKPISPRSINASLYLGFNTILESNSGMVCEHVLPRPGVVNAPDGDLRPIDAPDYAGTVAVYRHPDISTVRHRLAHEVRDIVHAFFGKNYGEAYRLITLWNLPQPSKRRAMAAVMDIEERPSSKEALGSFCSALIAHFYGRLKLPLFSNERAPSDVSPDDLAHSFLKPVAGVVIRRVPENIQTAARADEPYNLSPAIVKGQLNLDKMLRWVGDLREDFRKVLIDTGEPSAVLVTIFLNRLSYIRLLLEGSFLLTESYKARASKLVEYANALAPDLKLLLRKKLDDQRLEALVMKFRQFKRSHVRCEILQAIAVAKRTAGKARMFEVWADYHRRAQRLKQLLAARAYLRRCV